MFVKFLKPNFVNVLRRLSVAADGAVAISNSPDTTAENKKYSEYEKNELSEVRQSDQKVHRTDLSDISKIVRPGALSSLYVNESDILQQLVKIGVKLYEIEKDPEAMKFILSNKFEDIKDNIIFLKELGVETDKIGFIITKNPFILQENLDDLKVRINYLQYKRFTDQMIVRIVENNPAWLTHSTQEIDNRLGFFQSSFTLTGNEIRLLTTKCPKLITYPLSKVKLNTFVLKEEMGFTPEEVKSILLRKPQLFKNSQVKMLKTFEYFHNTMKLPLEMIIETPEVLNCRVKRLKERHLFLVKLGKVQYDKKMPNYIALSSLISGTDAYFSTEVANSSVKIYNEFLKTL